MKPTIRLALACNILLLAVAFACGAERPGAATPKMAKSVARHDITWTFDKAYHVGQFVNGDPWVLGPVTIVSVAPGWDGAAGGTQVDPPVAREQGFRKEYKFGGPYKEVLRAHFPLTLAGTHSVVSTIGMKPQRKGGAYEAFESASVLTVVAEVPPKDAFRPPYIKGPKPIFTVGQIHWDRLPTLDAPEEFAGSHIDLYNRPMANYSSAAGTGQSSRFALGEPAKRPASEVQCCGTRSTRGRNGSPSECKGPNSTDS